MDYRFLKVKHETIRNNAVQNMIGCVAEAAFSPKKIMNVTFLETIFKKKTKDLLINLF